jgi:hypothetical protein
MSELRTFKIRERTVDLADQDHRVRIPDDPAASAVRTRASLELDALARVRHGSISTFSA